MPASPAVLVADELEQLRCGVVLFDDRVADVRTVEARRRRRAPSPRSQPRDDLRARLRVRGGGERDARHAGEALVQHRELQVLGPEIVAPLRHAVRLVDREQCDLAALQQVEEAAASAAARAPRRAGRARRVDWPLDAAPARRRSVELRNAAAHAQLRAAPSPGPASARSAARPRRPAVDAPAPEPGSRATCRRRSASGRAHRRRRRHAGRSPPAHPGSDRSRRLRGGPGPGRSVPSRSLSIAAAGRRLDHEDVACLELALVCRPSASRPGHSDARSTSRRPEPG